MPIIPLIGTTEDNGSLCGTVNTTIIETSS